MTAKQTTERYHGPDLYRLIACAFVIINHCNSKVMIQVTPKSLAWYVTVGVIFITKICVPGFFMIMGFNLLHRREDMHTYFGRIKRIVGVLVIFSLFYYVWRCIAHTVAVDLPASGGALGTVFAYICGYFKVLFIDGATDAFWYLYTYLGLLIMMPLMQLAASRFDAGSAVSTDAVNGSAPGNSAGNGMLPRRSIITIIALSSVYISLVPSISVLAPGFILKPDLVIPILLPSVMYLFIGHAFYLYRDELGAGKGLKFKDMLLAAGFVIAFVVNMILSMAEYSMTGGSSYVSYSEINMIGMVIESICTFAFFLKIRAGGNAGRIISAAAPVSFGIYLFADFMCSNTHLIYYYLCQYMNRLAAVAIQDIAAYAAAFGVTFALRLIPGVKKWI